MRVRDLRALGPVRVRLLLSSRASFADSVSRAIAESPVDDSTAQSTPFRASGRVHVLPIVSADAEPLDAVLRMSGYRCARRSARSGESSSCSTSVLVPVVGSGALSTLGTGSARRGQTKR
ncbi:hypothetical protein EXIGLDRAFT_716654 [Exidia glandulosa HHB12029]|uniref:Uncharacterized protein n=1 Tax=Exidia glandulosa HHB12029 TaxID=1314781 RepID=A0A166MVE5_EXIGL|nr:hypothetical protein EXIGLDRAFT_716654 [Exidia glandulosa HHB12029]